jgi:probable phosphoglycerate mutase
MLRLYILRHGETDYNKQRIVQGSGVDAPLNETGLKQAQKFFNHYKNVPFEAVYSSELLRAYQTIKPFEILYPIQKKPEINELSWGMIEGKPFEGEVTQIYWEANQQWAKGNLDYKIENGESPNEIWKKANHFLNHVIKEHKSNVLICTHGRTMKILFSQLLGYGMAFQDIFTHPNTSLTILKYIHPQHFIVEKFNDISHLEA